MKRFTFRRFPEKRTVPDIAQHLVVPLAPTSAPRVDFELRGNEVWAGPFREAILDAPINSIRFETVNGYNIVLPRERLEAFHVRVDVQTDTQDIAFLNQTTQRIVTGRRIYLIGSQICIEQTLVAAVPSLLESFYYAVHY